MMMNLKRFAFICVFYAALVNPTSGQSEDQEWKLAERLRERLEIHHLSLTIDNNEDIVVTGFFYDHVNVDGEIIKSHGGMDILLAKFDKDENLLWYKHAGGANIDFSRFVNTDSQNNIYIQGLYRGEARFENVHLNSNGTYDFFTVKYDNQGKLLWVKTKKHNSI